MFLTKQEVGFILPKLYNGKKEDFCMKKRYVLAQ